MLLHNYSDTYKHAKATITVPNTAAQSAAVNNTDKKVIFKNYSPFTNCLSKIYNREVDDDQDIDIVFPIYNLKEYGDAAAKTSASLSQYYRDEPALDNKNNFIGFHANDNILPKVKQQITGETRNGGTKILK